MIEGRSGSSRLAIAGGGISGLTAAYYALRNGQPGEDIHIYEATPRLGGKIESVMLGDAVVNKGSEFIDSTNTSLIALCKELGVELVPSSDQQTETFQKPNGTLMPADKFYAEYKPIAEQIMRDKKAIIAEPNGELAKKLNAMTTEQYLAHLGNTVPVEDRRNFLQKSWDFVTFRKPRVNPDIVKMAQMAYASESGQPASRSGALQFVEEASATHGRFLDSDCGFRVAGGTEEIVRALKARLKEKGVSFHHNCNVTGISKADGKIKLAFAENSGGETSAECDKVIMALPAYELAKVQGLDALGLSAEAQKTLRETQYANNMKFTVKLKPGVKLPDAQFYSNCGFQCWSPAPGQMTFLCSNADMKSDRPAEMVEKCMETYARGMGMKADDIFEKGQGNIVFNNPGNRPCYASPAPGQIIALANFTGSLDALAANGVGIAGTYIPLHSSNGRMGIGFMECGVDSAREASMKLCCPVRGGAHELDAARTIPYRASTAGDRGIMR
jgi:monoamine oxidase